MEKFVLPKKWCVKVTNENRAILDEWRHEQPNFQYDCSLVFWLVSDGWRDSSYCSFNVNLPEVLIYKEITFEQFKEHVLKTKTMYTIEELNTNENLVVYIDSQEEFDQLKKEWLKLTSLYYGKYCYRPFDRTYSSESSKTFPGNACTGATIVYFNDIKLNTMKQDKEIIGYKLIKPEYKIASAKIMDANYKFELDNEFNETIKSRGREEFSYNSFSQGEKMRIDLAILFTWRELIKLKNSSAFNILFMDEIMDGATDQDGIDSIMNIIKSLKNNVFIISHNDKIDPAQFDHHLCMIKKGNFSQIEDNV
jgi:hypothetical protein